jgi:hypothetical protein
MKSHRWETGKNRQAKTLKENACESKVKQKLNTKFSDRGITTYKL